MPTGDLNDFLVTNYLSTSGSCPQPYRISIGMFGEIAIPYDFYAIWPFIYVLLIIGFAWLSGLILIGKINSGG